jgi:signal transduction histidine kinase
MSAMIETVDTSGPADSPAAMTLQLRRLAHDLNNALTPVLANAQLIQLVLGPDSSVSDELEDVVAGAKRANAIVGEIRALATRLAEART